MEKKNLQPQQQKPVVRATVAKPAIGVLSEEQLTAGWSGASSIAPSWWQKSGWTAPFAGDDAE